ncbi:LysR family transcriptional regulator [Nocardia macrotermitis]|uniref:Putative HTH-type transcriptional regulator n=1 Tax=Nocardia macrotermitis TaxID=2585198 RepID=A0A7K0DAI8_9NOCA|nr:LysR family transcriptional regulator [Nocardia macrotermitis]MQY22805.1 putative HTH-type transcriptional regulator [Nocardia macrotermitis]
MSRRLPDFGALELLVGVDDYGSLSAAGRRLGIPQPNASRAIQRLERQFGVPLLQRRTSGSTLTPQGTVVAHWARIVLADTDKLLDVVQGLRVGHSAELTVGASMTVAEHLMPRWLGQLRGLHPEMTVHLEVYNSATVFEKVLNGEYTIGFVESPTVPQELHGIAVGRDELVVVVHPEHPWAGGKHPIPIAELASTPLVVREPGSGMRTTLDMALQEYDRAEPLLELGSAAAIRTSVLEGVGPAVLSTLAVRDHIASGALRTVDVEGLDLTRILRAVWRSPRKLDGPAGELVQLACGGSRNDSAATGSAR